MRTTEQAGQPVKGLAGVRGRVLQLLVVAVAGATVADLDGVLDAGEQRLRIDRLDHVMVDTSGGGGAADLGYVGVAGEQDPDHARVRVASKASASSPLAHRVTS